MIAAVGFADQDLPVDMPQGICLDRAESAGARGAEAMSA